MQDEIRTEIAEKIINGMPLSDSVLADILMDERIYGDMKQDTIFCKDVIGGVKCELTVKIIDHRPCYCGAELREVWRFSQESEDQNESMR